MTLVFLKMEIEFWGLLIWDKSSIKIMQSALRTGKMLTACLIVLGKPSRMNPDSPLDSPASSLLDSKLIIISSETNFPWLTISASCKGLIKLGQGPND